MSYTYLIGGGPAAGKTSVAKELCKKHGLEYLKADDLVGEHQPEAAEREYPINKYVESLPKSEQELELIKFTAKQELNRQAELFSLLMEELGKRDFDKMLIEGNCLLPGLVAEHWEYPFKGVWLMPNKAFQDKIFLERDWAKELIQKSDDPTLTLHNWMHRDRKFIEEVQNQAERHDYPYLIIDGTEPLSYTVDWAEKKLSLV